MNVIHRYAILLVLFRVCAGSDVAAGTPQPMALRLPAEAPAAASEGQSLKDPAAEWFRRLLAFPYTNAVPSGPALQLIRQDFEQLERNRSVIGTPLIIGSRGFAHGLGTHSISHLRVLSPEPIDRFDAWVGVDANERTKGGGGSVIFSVETDGRELFRSPVRRGGEEPVQIAVSNSPPSEIRTLDLRVGDAGDGPSCDHADWADAAITLRSGRTLRLDELPQAPPPDAGGRYPFSFAYNGQSSDTLLPAWSVDSGTTNSSEGVTTSWRAWTDAATGLRVRWESRTHRGFPDCEWVLYFENTGSRDTPIIENIQALDLALAAPLARDAPYRLHRTKGAPADPTDFEPATVVLKAGQTERLSAGGGRSSNRDFPFFKSFHSTLAASLIPAWIADAPGFERERARQMLDRYRAIRHLLVGAWYPLLPYTRNPRDWMAVQFHRPDLGEGMILAFRHAESPYRTVEVALRGLKLERSYALTFDSSGEKREARGADLMRGLLLSLDTRPSSELITYREIGDAGAESDSRAQPRALGLLPGLWQTNGFLFKGAGSYRGVGANYFDLFLRVLHEPTNSTEPRRSGAAWPGGHSIRALCGRL